MAEPIRRVESPPRQPLLERICISVSASYTSFLRAKKKPGKITIALINERGRGGEGWLIGDCHRWAPRVPFYRASLTHVVGERSSVATSLRRTKRKEANTPDGQINYSGTTMARAASLLALIKLSPLPRALLPLSVQPIATYGCLSSRIDSVYAMRIS